MTMMMSQLGPVGTVLSVVFVVFMTVLFLELCYVWCSRHRRLQEARADSNIVQAMKRGHCTWPTTVWACRGGPAAESEEPKRWGKLLWWRPPVEAKMAWSDGIMQEEGKAGKQREGLSTVRGEGEEDLEEADEEDVLRMGGLWGPPRLLFTIKEETKEEMELEEVRCCVKGGRASSDLQQLLLFSATSSSSCTSPFVTPPSSPPFATPLGSPGAASARPPPPAWDPPPPANSTHHAVAFLEVDSSSSSNSNSSSSPLLQSRRHLSILFDDTSSFSPSSVASTPVEALSPSSAGAPSSSACSSPNKRAQRHPLCLLLDPPPLQGSSLYHYHIKRVHPLTQAGDGEPKSLPSQLPLAKPEPPLPFHIPMPSQPTTPCPFRPSLHAKGGAASSPLTTLLHPRVMNRV